MLLYCMLNSLEEQDLWRNVRPQMLVQRSFQLIHPPDESKGHTTLFIDGEREKRDVHLNVTFHYHFKYVVLSVFSWRY
jgi:hypothetical protein